VWESALPFRQGTELLGWMLFAHDQSSVFASVDALGVGTNCTSRDLHANLGEERTTLA
jgi:hypothetical protein